MDKIIPIRITDSLVQKIDAIVERGSFKNRTEGIRAGIRNIVKEYGVKSIDRQLIAQIIANYLLLTHSQEIIAIFLFGSVANGTDTSESDIDIFILVKKELNYQEKYEFFNEITHLLQGLEFMPSLQFEDKVTFKAAIQENYEFESKIIRKGKFLAGQIPEDLLKFRD